MALPAAPLFGDAPPAADRERTAGMPAPVVRRRETAARVSLLGDRRSPAPLVTLNLFADVTYVARLVRVEVVEPAGYAWVGEVLGLSGSAVTLAVAGDVLTGTIDTGAAYYSVHPGEAPRRYYIDQVDRSALPRPR